MKHVSAGLLVLGASSAAAVAVAALACGPSSPAASDDAGVDAGSDGPLTLPADLEACGTTEPKDVPPASFEVDLRTPPVKLGDGVRANALVLSGGATVSFETVTSSGYQSQGGSGNLMQSAQPLGGTATTIFDESGEGDSSLDIAETNGTPVTGSRKLSDYEAQATADPRYDLAYRVLIQRFVGPLTAFASAPTPGRPATQPNDRWIDSLTPVSFADATIRLRPSGDAACHVRNLKRIVALGHGPADLTTVSGLSLDAVATADNAPLVELYARTANVTSRVSVVAVHSGLTKSGASLLAAGAAPCTLGDLAACAALVESVKSRVSKSQDGIGSPGESDAKAAALPAGWIFQFGGLSALDAPQDAGSEAGDGG
jgi:hypothetical protein